jgi:hypothetical protein
MNHLLENLSIEVRQSVFFAASQFIIDHLAARHQISPAIIDIALERVSFFVQQKNFFHGELPGGIVGHLRHLPG